MTVNEIVSYIKGLLKQHDRSKGIFTDKYIWETFLIARAEVLSNFRLRRFNYKNPQNYTTFCMELEKAKSHQCGCITQGCDVLVTKNKLPKYFTGRNSGTLKIHTLGNNSIDVMSEPDYFSVYAYDDAYNDEIVGSIINNKIVIWNSLDLKGVQVRAFWEDITQIDDAQWCSDADEDSPGCIDVYNKDIGLDKDLVLETLRRVREILDLPLRIQEDTTNNSNAKE